MSDGNQLWRPSAPPPKQLPLGFGSFASADPELLIRQPPGEYTPPPLPFPPPSLDAAALAERPFGEPFRPEFLIDFGRWAFINAGAFGGVLAAVAQDAEQWRRHCEAQPLAFIDRELFPQLVRVIRDVAAFVGADPQDLVLLPNATTGLNAVITSVTHRLKPGDVVYSLDIGYGSVKKMLAVACDDCGANHVMAHVPLPVSGPDSIVSVVEATLPRGAALAVFDAVTSNTALALPLERIIRICRERGVPVLIDAAHGPGQLPLNIGALDPDYLVANTHKWLGGARGSALMWVRRDKHASVRPLVVSHGSGRGLLSDFIWDGCRDYAPLLSLSTALTWWRTVGSDRARQYMRGLLADAVALLEARWGTRALAPPELCAAMACVELPAAAVAAAQRLRKHGEQEEEQQQQKTGEEQQEQGGRPPVQATAAAERPSSEDGNWIQDYLHYIHAIEVPVKFLAGRLFVRISAAVYNTPADYERLADAVQQLASTT